MGSSSKRKSFKKKSSKLSSQARKMKKSRRTKSKKLGRKSKKLGRQRCHDSSTDDSLSSHSISSAGNRPYTSYSDDDSMSSASVSTPPSSKGTYRRTKNVSHSRRNLKKTRKRARRRSSSRESIGELARMKKIKRSKKDSDSKARAKSRRKKPRRDASISSASSDSHSCSTCKGGSNSDTEESERERVRSRFREKKKDNRDLEKDKRGTKMSICRSPSHSSYSRSRDQGGSVNHSEERFPSENNSRRLRSVITFAEQMSEGEGNKRKKDLQNEEIVYDHDDYPSRSSSGGGSKKQSHPCSPIALDGEKQTESVKFVSDYEVTEPSGIVNDANEQYVHDPLVNEVETHSSAKESRNSIPSTDAGSGGDDLEAILRQKALQNFKKFRGGHKSNIKPTANQKNKDKDDGDVNPSSTYMAEIVQSRLPKQAALTDVEMDASTGVLTGKVSEIAKQNTDRPDGLALSGNPRKEAHDIGHPVFGKSMSGNSSFKGRSSGSDTLNQTTTSGASPDKNLRKSERSEMKTTTLVETTYVTGNSSFLGRSSGLDTLNKTTRVASLDKNLMETERSEKETEPKITQSVSPSIGINTGTAAIEPASCATSGGQSLNNQKDEAKNSAQYQQKTMSVMRGGEMVQVNYKVYIPQRAPALTRRRLKR